MKNKELLDEIDKLEDGAQQLRDEAEKLKHGFLVENGWKVEVFIDNFMTFHSCTKGDEICSDFDDAIEWELENEVEEK